jgi:hypothetical protein
MKANATRQGQRRGQAEARYRYLAAVSRCVPAAIAALAVVDPDDDPAIYAWAQRWGFLDGWALETAREHARFWRANPEKVGQWVSVSGAPANMEPLDRPVWDPAFESEATFRARVEAYIQRVRDTGLPISQAKTGERHFEWLARHVVGGVLQVTLANELTGKAAISESAISQAIKEAATMIGVTTRRVRPRVKPSRPPLS